MVYKNVSIISLDNYTSGNKKNHINDSKVEYIHGNTWDISNISVIQKFNPEYVFHLGEFSRIVLSFEKTKSQVSESLTSVKNQTKRYQKDIKNQFEQLSRWDY